MSSIAIIGASSDRKKFGNKCVRAYQQAGWKVYPIHPTEKMIEGLSAYSSIKDVPTGNLDRVSLYLPPAVGLKILGDLSAKDIGELWLNPGADSPELEQKARAQGLNVIRDCSIVALGVSPSEFP